MTLYNNSIYLPAISLPQIDAELSDAVSDDRMKIAEVEAAFEEFERELVTELYSQCQASGRRGVNYPTDLDDLVSATNGTALSRTSAGHGLNSSLLTGLHHFAGNLTLDHDMQDMHLSTLSTPRTPAGRLPRRIVVPRSVIPTSTTNSLSANTLDQTTTTTPGLSIAPQAPNRANRPTTIGNPIPSISDIGVDSSLTEPTRSWSPINGPSTETTATTTPIAATDAIATTTTTAPSDVDSSDMFLAEDEDSSTTEPDTGGTEAITDPIEGEVDDGSRNEVQQTDNSGTTAL